MTDHLKTAENYIIESLVAAARMDDSIASAIQDMPPVLEKPKDQSHGDLAANVALVLSKKLKKNPREIAQQLMRAFPWNEDYVKGDPALATTIKGPGFINFFFSKRYLLNQLRGILDVGEQFGRSKPSGEKVLVEFVSANPTGPLTIGHGRQAVIGDTISNLLEWQGHTVSREYYFNDGGRQMRVLGDSTRARYLELLGEPSAFPEDGYQGDYIRDIAAKMKQAHGDGLKSNDDITLFKDMAEREIFADIEGSLKRMNIVFDSFFNEKSLYDNGEVERTVDAFKKQNLAYEEDGAVWFKSTAFGLEQDRVIVKSSGEPTYRLPDMAYHRNKFERGFDLMVDVFGADHKDTVPDVMAGVKALGYDSEKVKVLIHQFVTLYQGKEKVKMSTRKANFVTLDELMDEVGPDVTRWFFLMRGMETHLNFDIQLAKTESDENPVFYNQYAHARVCSILRNAKEKGIIFSADTSLAPLAHESEMNLIKRLIMFPRLVAHCATEFAPHRLTTYLSDISTAFHRFYTDCRVLSDDEALSSARLALCVATKTVIGNGLKILGVSAPEKM